MQNGDFPGNSAKLLDYQVILHYKLGMKIAMGLHGFFLFFLEKAINFPGIFSRSHILTTTPVPAPR